MADRGDVVVQGIRWFRTFVSSRRWREGKADPSHEYRVRDWLPGGEQDFVRAASLIKEQGEPAMFQSRNYIYLHEDGMRYWTMDNSAQTTTLVSRARDCGGVVNAYRKQQHFAIVAVFAASGVNSCALVHPVLVCQVDGPGFGVWWRFWLISVENGSSRAI